MKKPTPSIHLEPRLLDTTLRDGEQAAGVAFSPAVRISLAQRIAAVGVGEMEIGIPVMGEAEIASINAIAALNLPCRLSVWCRLSRRDLEAAKRCRVDTVHFSVPTSRRHRSIQHLEEGTIQILLRELIPEAAAHFDAVSIGAQDASRSDPDELAALAATVRALGAQRLRLADTVGVWSPRRVGDTIEILTTAFPDLAIGFHGHNDLGLATANALSALEAGAASVDVTVNGLGERAGNAALEEVAMALSLWEDDSPALRTPVLRTDMLRDLSQSVARASKRILPVGKPVTGSACFRHESGIHVDGLQKDPASYEPFAPERVGAKGREFVLGRHSGRAALQDALGRLGLHMAPAQEKELLQQLRRNSERSGRGLSLEEFKRLVENTHP